MKRDIAINVLLIIAGIVLAFLLFSAGALWRGKSLPKNSRTVAPRQNVSIRSVVPREYSSCLT
jgi:hypothetical protein